MSDSLSPTMESAPAESSRPRKRGFLFKGVALVAVIAAGVAGVHYTRLALSSVSTDDAFINGHVHRISAGVAGPLLEVLVDENQQVKKGELLAKIDPLEFEIMEKKALAALEQAKARELQARAKASEARSAEFQADATIATAEAAIREAEAKLALANITFKRNDSLIQGNAPAIAQAEVDNARSGVSAAEAGLASARAQLQSAKAGKESSASAIQAAEAEIASAAADIEAQQSVIQEARRQMSFANVIAPTDGRIGNKNAETGNRVQVGQALYAVVEEDYWVIGNFKETQLKKMRVGQPVEISIDALGDHHFTGHVDSIAPATGAQFALLPPDNATGNFTKVVQRVPVKITFDADSIRGFEQALRPGLSTVVRVHFQ